MGVELGFLALEVVVVVERLPRNSVGVIEVEAYEGSNNFDVVTGVGALVVVVFGCID